MACNPSGKLVKQADVFAQQQQYDDASTYYYNALLANARNNHAKEGLKVVGQKVLTTKFAVFSKLVLQNKIADAIKQYDYAQQYYRNAQQVGVNLDWPYEYEEVYTEIRKEFAEQLFDEAFLLMNQKKFDLAEKKFEQIASLDSTYSGISVLRINTVLEALYKNATKLMALGKFKDAFNVWSKLLKLDENYKDAAYQRDEAQKKATKKLAVFPITPYFQEKSAFEQSIDAQLNKTSLAYVQIVPIKELNQLLVNSGWDLVANKQQVLDAAKTTGMTYSVLVKLIDKTDSTFSETVKNGVAYEAFSENILNPYTGTYSYITKFKKVAYTDRFYGIKLVFNFHLEIIETATGNSIYADDITVDKSDEVHTLSFDGNPNNLYQELPKDNFLPAEDPAWREQFTQSKRKVLSRDVLLKEAYKELSFRIAFAVNKFIK